MQIQQPQLNTNFTARYRVLLTEKEFDNFHENILPKLDKIHDGNVDYLHAKSPSEFAFPKHWKIMLKPMAQVLIGLPKMQAETVLLCQKVILLFYGLLLGKKMSNYSLSLIKNAKIF